MQQFTGSSPFKKDVNICLYNEILYFCELMFTFVETKLILIEQIVLNLKTQHMA